MNGSVFPSFHPVIIRETFAAHTDATSYPYPPCWGLAVFAGDVNGAAEYDLDVVRDRESAYVVCALGGPQTRHSATRLRYSSRVAERKSSVYQMGTVYGSSCAVSSDNVYLEGNRVRPRVYRHWHEHIFTMETSRNRASIFMFLTSGNIHTSIHGGVIQQVLLIMPEFDIAVKFRR